MMAGVSTPLAEIARPGPPGPGGEPGPAPPVPVLQGTDSVLVYLDTDGIPLTGLMMDGLDFGADHLIMVTGINGLIIERQAFEWNGAGRDWTTIGTLEAENDATRVEMQIPLSRLGLDSNSSFDIYFEASDWTGRSDRSDDKVEIIDPLQLEQVPPRQRL